MKHKCATGAGRDNNVKLLYHLENHELPAGRRFASIVEAQEYVNFITATNVWVKTPGLPRFVKVYSLGDLDYSEAQPSNEIWLANRHLDQQVVLHELAHFFRQGTPNHGPAFVNFYLFLVGAFMGTWYADVYREAFEREGIKL